MLTSLNAITPIDGRYYSKVKDLSNYFSEYALIKYRAMVEVEYFIALCELPLPELSGVESGIFATLRSIYQNFSEEDAQRVKDIEKTTNHDVKAVEYFLKEKFASLGVDARHCEFIHFGLTSQDINNTAIPISLMQGIEDVYLPELQTVVDSLEQMARDWADIPMLAHTHGQPASPTRLGKEIMVWVVRLREQMKALKAVPYAAKFGGATGGFNAHFVAYPDIDWHNFADSLLEDRFGLKRSFPTTQIEHYDHIAALFDAIKRIGTILIDLSRDIWTYISMEYFRQRVVAGEVGSSAMPHKVNPIDFENAEGNLGLSGAVCEHLSRKLPISRMQRDLTDSTVLRNVGLPVAYSVIAFKSLQKGLGKLILNREALERDLDRNWEVTAEAVQTILRREGYPKPYETLKALTRTGKAMSQEVLVEFVRSLDVRDSVKEEILNITPFNYTGR
ncbi:MAG: adenylosuccinate lyase [Bacteroidales bacterium]|nr:adenylosuccinate lyase [Bacteroidales bacterium]